MTKLSSDEQLKASYTKAELIDLIERKAKIAGIVVPYLSKAVNKSALIIIIRELDKFLSSPTPVEDDFIEDEGGVIEGAALIENSVKLPKELSK